MKLGILALGRPTFDVTFAETKLAAMLVALDATEHQIVGPRTLLFDEQAARTAIAQLSQEQVDSVLLLQVTFTDSTMTALAAETFERLAIWSIPEPRLGGRLRLNSLCGLNLASHTLGLNDKSFGWLYADPEQDITTELDDLLAGKRGATRLSPAAPPAATADGRRIAEAIKGKRIARIGRHPEGFDTCAYNQDTVEAIAGIKVEPFELEHLFDSARAVPAETAAELREQIDSQLVGVDELDQQQLDRSLRLKAGLDTIRTQGNYDAFAIRCWPETFTEYGGAVCGPAGMLAESRIPCACEADVFGSLSQLVLLETAQAPVFLTDLVDIDIADNTAVLWHCGQAPLSMRDPEAAAEATVHTNRRQPLLYQFPLKPGAVTLMRISQGFNQPHMVLTCGQMLRRPMAFTGTSGVLRFERQAREVLDDIISAGLEHHMVLTYGDHRQTLRAVAGAMDLPLLEI